MWIESANSPHHPLVLQEQFLRSSLFHNHYSFLSTSGYEIDEDGQSQSQKEQQELLMKMFAVSVKTPHTPAEGSLFIDKMIAGLAE